MTTRERLAARWLRSEPCSGDLTTRERLVGAAIIAAWLLLSGLAATITT